MSCPDPKASIYYSTIGGVTKTPVNLYTGPITVENYDPDQSFTLGLTAVREGYANAADPIVYFSSSEISDAHDAPSFVYSLKNSTEDVKTGMPFTMSAMLSRIRIVRFMAPNSGWPFLRRFTTGSVSAGSEWEYGVATVNGGTVVTLYI